MRANRRVGREREGVNPSEGGGGHGRLSPRSREPDGSVRVGGRSGPIRRESDRCRVSPNQVTTRPASAPASRDTTWPQDLPFGLQISKSSPSAKQECFQNELTVPRARVPGGGTGQEEQEGPWKRFQ